MTGRSTPENERPLARENLPAHCHSVTEQFVVTMICVTMLFVARLYLRLDKN